MVEYCTLKGMLNIYIYIYPVYLVKFPLRDSVLLAQQARDFVQGDWTQPKS